MSDHHLRASLGFTKSFLVTHSSNAAEANVLHTVREYGVSLGTLARLLADVHAHHDRSTSHEKGSAKPEKCSIAVASALGDLVQSAAMTATIPLSRASNTSPPPPPQLRRRAGCDEKSRSVLPQSLWPADVCHPCTSKLFFTFWVRFHGISCPTACPLSIFRKPTCRVHRKVFLLSCACAYRRAVHASSIPKSLSFPKFRRDIHGETRGKKEQPDQRFSDS